MNKKKKLSYSLGTLTQLLFLLTVIGYIVFWPNFSYTIKEMKELTIHHLVNTQEIIILLSVAIILISYIFDKTLKIIQRKQDYTI